MKRNRIGRVLITAAMGVFLIPAALQAQESRSILISDLPLAEQARIQAEIEAREGEAGDLLRDARTAEQAGDWGRAGRLYEESAGLRSDADHLGALSYERAGRAYFFSDQMGRASRMWEEAASRALIVGDVIGAARNYLHAAVAAQEKGKRSRAADLGWRAYRLTESEHLSSQERDLIRQHLEVEGSNG